MAKIPLSQPEILDEDILAVQRVMKSGQLAFGGVQTSFENSFTNFCGVDHALAVSSGTAALHLAVELSGIQQSDEVIVSPFSFIASSNVVLYQRAKPVFVDIEEDTLGIDPALIPSALSDKTKAILPTHVFGHPCKIEAIAAICAANELTLIEDNCESLGASLITELGEKKTGQFGDYAAYGFYPNKLMTTGEGGMLVVADEKKVKLAASLRNQGRSDMQGQHLVHDVLGYNYRLSDMQSALGLSQLSRISKTINRRNQIASKYNKLFQGVDEVRTLAVMPSNQPAWFVYCVRVPKEKRDPLIDYLTKNDIQTRPYFYPPIHLQPFYQKEFGFEEGDFPVAEKVSKEMIALPFFNQLTQEQIFRVAEAVKTGLDQI